MSDAVTAGLFLIVAVFALGRAQRILEARGR
jgi:Cft2 family RNA processing exonuclease